MTQRNKDTLQVFLLQVQFLAISLKVLHSYQTAKSTVVSPHLGNYLTLTVSYLLASSL